MTPKKIPSAGTICRCGLAKSYHDGRLRPSSEYVPRYDQESFERGYIAGLSTCQDKDSK